VYEGDKIECGDETNLLLFISQVVVKCFSHVTQSVGQIRLDLVTIG
jgi:hypothetical protein